jgi:hypothetical protein
MQVNSAFRDNAPDVNFPAPISPDSMIHISFLENACRKTRAIISHHFLQREIAGRAEFHGIIAAAGVSGHGSAADGH